MGADARAQRHQVLCISHLPQIAAFADSHFKIAKRQFDDRTVSNVARIDGEERVDEIAAMLDGVPLTDASRANARVMLERASAWKDQRLRRAGIATHPARICARPRARPSQGSGDRLTERVVLPKAVNPQGG